MSMCEFYSSMVGIDVVELTFSEGVSFMAVVCRPVAAVHSEQTTPQTEYWKPVSVLL